MIRHRLSMDCDHPGCPHTLISGPLDFHGSMGDFERLISQAIAMGWRYVPAVGVEAGPDGSVRPEGPWHFCPTHRADEHVIDAGR